MPITVEYYSDNTLIYDPLDPVTTQADDGFIVNTDDSCSTYDATAGTLANFTGNLLNTDVEVTGAGTFASGVATSITFHKIGDVTSGPGAGNEGTVNLLLNDNLSNWLTYNWNYDCDNADGDDNTTTGVDTEPCGTASFGIYRGDDRIIYWREVFQ